VRIRDHRLAAAAVFMLTTLSSLACSSGSPGDPGTLNEEAAASRVEPAASSIATSESVKFSAIVRGSVATDVAWSVVEPDGGAIDADGIYTAPDGAGTYHVAASIDGVPTAEIALAEVRVAPRASSSGVLVVVNPQAAGLSTGESVLLRADVTGAANTSVTWSVQEGAPGGVVTDGGTYTAPQAAGVFHVIARSTADSTRADVATITVTAPAPSVDPNWVDVTAFGAAGDGVTDDTAAFIKAAATGKNLRVPKPSAHYKLTSKIRVYGSVQGVGMPEIRMYGADGLDGHSMFELSSYSGTGAVFSGLHLNGGWDGAGTAGEWSHLIVIKGSRNVTVENNLLERAYGDCVLVGGEGVPIPSQNVVVRNNELSEPRRCTVALVSAKQVVIQENVHRKHLSNYISTVDLEPNSTGVDVVDGVSILDNTFDCAAMWYHGPVVILYNPPGNAGAPQSGNITLSGNHGTWVNAFFGVIDGSQNWVNVSASNNTLD
jgi:Pectate lyase superfamily protein